MSRQLSSRRKLIASIAFLILPLGPGIAQAQTVRVVDIIPAGRSGETNSDSEPNLAVNPANPLQIAGSAFTPDPALSGRAPIFRSTDGGLTWQLSAGVLPGGNSTADITLRFGGTSNTLYVGILRADNLNFDLIRAADFTSDVVANWQVLINRTFSDQPYIQAATVLAGPDAGRDRVYLGSNDISLRTTTGRTSTIDMSLDATAPAPAGFGAPVRIEPRITAALPCPSTACTGSCAAICSQDGPSVRPAIHPDGRIYVAYLGWRTFGTTTNTTDVVVARDDNWGIGAAPFTGLIDGDGNAGVRVVTGITTPSLNVVLGGTQRIGSQLSIAVDPRDSGTVYVAWADGATAPAYTIHVRRSTLAGAAGSWGADLRAISSATNPALAINTLGEVGLLSQRLTGSGASQRWETHLERSNDGFATPAADLVLARVPNSGFFFPLGDYAHLLTVGKNFYGIFSASNTPDLANFPNGVTYQRGANFTTHVLTNPAAGGATVAASVDPFFFAVIEGATGPADFYVRDWTDSLASADNGAEPSTHPYFYTTSDVWNRRTNSPAPFDALNRPQNEDPKNGSGVDGDNFAFSRISRNAGGTTEVVNARFLYSEFGTGSSYQMAGDPAGETIPFGPGDTSITMTGGHLWHLDTTASNHLCLAVEISTASDAVIPPGLFGHAPGWPTTDLMVINDNNKAQRNMHVLHLVRGGLGRFTFYGVVHNAALVPRWITLRYEVGADDQGLMKGSIVGALGGRSKLFRSGDAISMGSMQPGENRWIGIDLDTSLVPPERPLEVRFDEMVLSAAVNGFAAIIQPSSQALVSLENLQDHRSVFGRMGAAFGIKLGDEEAAAAGQLIQGEKIPDADYLAFLEKHADPMGQAVRELLDANPVDPADPFDTMKALDVLRADIRTGDLSVASTGHAAFLERLGAFLTMLQKMGGDPADILQNMHWQAALYRRLANINCSDKLLPLTDRFILQYEAMKIGNESYPKLLSEMMDCFGQTDTELGKGKLLPAIDTIGRALNSGSPAALQKAHREYLLALQALIPQG